MVTEVIILIAAIWISAGYGAYRLGRLRGHAAASSTHRELRRISELLRAG